MTSYLIVFGLSTLILLMTLWTTISYKFKADRLRVKATWEQVIGQKLHRTLTDDILEAAGIAVKEELNIDNRQLELHKLASGDPLKVVREIVEAKREGRILEYNVAVALDLGGEELRKILNQNK